MSVTTANDFLDSAPGILDSIQTILDEMDEGEMSEIVRDSLKMATKATIKHKKNSLVQTGKYLKGFAKKTKVYLAEKMDADKKGELKESFKDDYCAISGAICRTPFNIMKMGVKFAMLPKAEKKKQLVWGGAAVLTYFVTAGGFDREGGIPDMDITLLGIGHHRNVFFHSVLLGFGLEFTVRFFFAFYKRIHDKLPKQHPKSFDVLADFCESLETGIVQGMWLGTAAHLIKDASIFGGATKPLADLPGTHSMLFHKTILAGSAMAGAAFCTKGK